MCFFFFLIILICYRLDPGLDPHYRLNPGLDPHESGTFSWIRNSENSMLDPDPE